MNHFDSRLAIAPMMEWTDRHCRYFHRRLTSRALLYTEMVVADAVIHGHREKLLGFDPSEHPLALQIGGSEPAKLAAAARIGAAFGYDEINLNVGCPSDRVQSGAFGACLMLEPRLVAECVDAMKQVVDIPVTVKCRIGVDEQDPEVALDELADRVLEAGTDALWVHARKAWLKGLSPKENREVPPLDYSRVYRLKARLPHVFIGINGGIRTVEEARAHLDHLDGVMMGRAAYQTPGVLAGVDGEIYGEGEAPRDEMAAAEAMIPYLADMVSRGEPIHRATRHMLGLFHGRPGARRFRQVLSNEANLRGAGPEVLARALAEIGSRDAALAA
ncbi:tRNA dihydrouridine(20/20a) synthase DusA [Kaistia algarum]|uniref:tRNA dihydrouridine(20/20a) synthase DusA n=1 Tax=Kaistia algarum TaxID=2083279 RepID=UPI000CE8610B|nr:tRNA dihydrouridine(20/20a) synthase DusA [Kaistia algarum]MCX5514656.1 tRNA dihydrouridine(20/20a) synthase DusA [Kaistia algarum]PPE78911.1 tRNA dihydrouridine(20/20a) synthase DusA [Kaistia algarum]